jgi:hypothetical protein
MGWLRCQVIYANIFLPIYRLRRVMVFQAGGERPLPLGLFPAPVSYRSSFGRSRFGAAVPVKYVQAVPAVP